MEQTAEVTGLRKRLGRTLALHRQGYRFPQVRRDRMRNGAGNPVTGLRYSLLLAAT
jgi:hypothetical protein